MFEYLVTACVVAVLFVAITYIVYLFKDPRRKLTASERCSYNHLEEILSVYPNRRFWGKMTYEDEWFVRLREAYIIEVFSAPSNINNFPPEHCEHKLYTVLTEGKDDNFLDTYYYISLISDLYESIHNSGFYGEVKTLRKACLLDLRSRFAAYRKTHTIDPAIIEYFGEKWITRITTPDPV